MLTLIRSGNSGSCSIRGPSPSSGTASTSGRRRSTCGLPTLTAIGRSSSSQADRQGGGVHRIGERDRVPVEARPAHVDRPRRRPPASHASSAAARLDRAVLPSSSTGDAARGVAAGLDLAAVRVPDAHARHRRRRSGSIMISWSQPIPVRRSASARAVAAVDRDRPLARVEHDEIIAEAVHLVEADPHGARSRHPAGEVHRAAEILHFWLEETPPEKRFVEDPAIDAASAAALRAICAKRLLGAAAAGWRGRRASICSPRSSCSTSSPATCSATMRAPSRPIRSTRSLTREALARGWDRGSTRSSRQFLYMPLMHSEADGGSGQRAAALRRARRRGVAGFRPHATPRRSLASDDFRSATRCLAGRPRRPRPSSSVAPTRGFERRQRSGSGARAVGSMPRSASSWRTLATACGLP